LEFSFSITQTTGGGGGDHELIRSINSNVPLSLRPSHKIVEMKPFRSNCKIIIKQISLTEFKLLTDLQIRTNKQQEKFNQCSFNLLEEHIKEKEDKLITSSLSFKNLLSLDGFSILARNYKWNTSRVKLKCQTARGRAFLHLSLRNNEIPEDVLKMFELNINDIISVKCIQVESSLNNLYKYYVTHSYQIRTFNLTSLYADSWLKSQGFQPNTFVYSGFLGM